MLSHKECITCHQVKPLGDFYFRPDTQKYRNECKECFKAKSRLKATGWTPEEYQYALKVQSNRCAICGCLLDTSSETLGCADHDHSTGKPRGVLCMHCNTALGLFKDNIENLENAIRYIEEHKTK